MYVVLCVRLARAVCDTPDKSEFSVRLWLVACNTKSITALLASAETKNSQFGRSKSFRCRIFLFSEVHRAKQGWCLARASTKLCGKRHNENRIEHGSCQPCKEVILWQNEDRRETVWCASAKTEDGKAA